jgi:hypothetical protein
MKRLLAGALLAGAGVVATTTSAQQQETVDWRCGGAPGSTCYFVIRFASGGFKNFTMKGGSTDKISGVVPGKDTYCVCVDIPTPDDWAQCKSPYQGKFCRTATVQRGYND